MKKFYILMPLILLFGLPAEAKIFRVGYNGTPLSGVDFTSITQANDSAKVGDTLQIYGLQGGTINKRLVILGFGYNFNVHAGLQSNPGIQGNETANPSTIYDLTLDSGSDSTIIEGCQIYYSPGIKIRSQNVIIRRCSGNISFYGGIFLDNNSIATNGLKVNSSNRIYIFMNYEIPCKNIQMNNCINSYLYLRVLGTTGSIINCINSYPNYPEPQILVKNCIQNSYVAGGNTIWDNNIFLVGEPIPTLPGSNNKWNQVYDSVFVTPNPDPNISSLDENNYQLRPNSPAKNSGIDFSGNPTDCGIFGGELAYRYKIGGQPAIPAFYKLSAPTNSASSNPYNITVSVRSNN